MRPSLDEFVRARIAEDVARAKAALTARRESPGESGGRDWVGALTEAMDKRALLEIAVTAEWDDRREYAAEIRLADSYAHHPDYRAEWRG